MCLTARREPAFDREKGGCYVHKNLNQTVFSFFLVLVAAMTLSPRLAGRSPHAQAAQQPQLQVGSIDPSKFSKSQSLDDTLNDEAEATDTAGIHRYSEHLIQLLVPHRAGKKYIRSLTDRLEKAEELARAGKGSLVPEVKVAVAYNDLMKQVGAPSSVWTNETAVRNHRLAPLDKPSDALITMGRNGTNCNPGEAVYLLLALIWNNGGPRARLERAPGDTQPSVSTPAGWSSFGVISPSDPSASRSVETYSAAHRPRDTVALFNSTARKLGF
jgi:hypothetical protein